MIFPNNEWDRKVKSACDDGVFGGRKGEILREKKREGESKFSFHCFVIFLGSESYLNSREKLQDPKIEA